MQFIDFAINSIALASVGFFTFQFVSGLMVRHRKGQSRTAAAETTPAVSIPTTIAVPEGIFCCDAAPEDAALVDSYIASQVQHRTVRLIDNVVPFLRPCKRREATPDLNTLNPYQLRSECQKQGIKWRNAHGKNKHLTKAEMIALLRSAA